MNIFIRSCRNP